MRASRCGWGSVSSASRTTPLFKDDQTSSSTAGASLSRVSSASAPVRRLRTFSSRRTASTALWWVIDSSQVENAPREASNREASRHSVRKTSCTQSWANWSSARIRRASP